MDIIGDGMVEKLTVIFFVVLCLLLGSYLLPYRFRRLMLRSENALGILKRDRRDRRRREYAERRKGSYIGKSSGTARRINSGDR